MFVVNQASFFRSHRLPLAKEAIARGHDVIVLCGEGPGVAELEADGLRCRTIRLSRSGFNPWTEWRTYRAMARVYRDEFPDVVHHVTIKPVIYGTRLARSLGIRAVVNAIPGMGFVYTRRGLLASLRRGAVDLLYRLALVHPNMRLIFQNREDLQAFVGHTAVSADRAHLIHGSGVDVRVLAFSPEPDSPMSFVLVARMLKDKGVREFVAAARRLRAAHPDWQFRLVGGADAGNPASLTAEELGAWHDEGVVAWLGHRDDVLDLLRQSHVFCLPSFYREGLPKSLLEAAAVGRALITTDMPGCREVVSHGVTGLLVKPRDVEGLAAAMEQLGTDGPLRDRLRRAAREKAEAVFSIDDVVRDTFLIYEQLVGP